MILGKCPYCENGSIEVRDKEVSGKKVKLFSCSNFNVITEDGELWEPTQDSSCDFRIWQNTLSRYGKWLTYQEVRVLLEEQELKVDLVSKKYAKKINYTKHIVLDKEYGVSVCWDS